MLNVSSIVRRIFGENDEKRNAGLTVPKGIVRYESIVYGESPVWQSLDVYRPAGEKN